MFKLKAIYIAIRLFTPNTLDNHLRYKENLQYSYKMYEPKVAFFPVHRICPVPPAAAEPKSCSINSHVTETGAVHVIESPSRTY